MLEVELLLGPLANEVRTSVNFELTPLLFMRRGMEALYPNYAPIHRNRVTCPPFKDNPNLAKGDRTEDARQLR